MMSVSGFFSSTEQFGQMVQSELKRIGVQVNIMLLDGTTAIDRMRAGNYDAAYLSWDLDAWLVARLDAEALAVVRAAEREALRELAVECAQTFDADTRAVVGLPSSDIALELFRGVQAGLGLAA